MKIHHKEARHRPLWMGCKPLCVCSRFYSNRKARDKILRTVLKFRTAYETDRRGKEWEKEET